MTRLLVCPVCASDIVAVCTVSAHTAGRAIEDEAGHRTFEAEDVQAEVNWDGSGDGPRERAKLNAEGARFKSALGQTTEKEESMPETPDGAQRHPLTYAPQVLHVSATPGPTWAIVGGGEHDDKAELHVIVDHPTEPSLGASVVIMLPIAVSDGCLVVGAATVTDA